MATLDIFNDDAFNVTSLTDAINDTLYVPTRIADLGWFNERGVATTTMAIERKGSQLNLIPNTPRGSPGNVVRDLKARLIPIPFTHLEDRATVHADQVQNVRAFGTESEVETVQNLVNERLEVIRQNIDVTIEWQRMGAIKGQLLDADGTSVILDMFQTFELTQQHPTLALSVPATPVRSVLVGYKRLVEQALGGKRYTSLRCLCSAQFFDAFVEHPAVQRAWDNFQDRALLQMDLRGGNNNGSQTTGFFFGGVLFEEYRGNVNGHDFIPAGEAYLCPEGVNGMYLTRFAPADYMETVNTTGLPYYAKQELLRFNKGVEIEGQSNPINFVTNPDAIIRISAV
jgi:hypothetical protein